MKKNVIIALIAVLSVSVLQSCNDDSDVNLNYSQAMVTVKPLTSSDYYFVLDDDKTIYPSNKKGIGQYPAEDGQRAIILFQFLSEKVADYDYNAELFRIQDILTKDPKTVTTQEELDKIGDDRLDIIRDRYDVPQVWISGGHLNIYFGLQAGANTEHEMNLIVNQVVESLETEEGYTDVEFRQRADRSSSGYYHKAWVSFRLGELDPAVSGDKGLNVRVKTSSGEIKHYKVEPQKEA